MQLYVEPNPRVGFKEAKEKGKLVFWHVQRVSKPKFKANAQNCTADLKKKTESKAKPQI